MCDRRKEESMNNKVTQEFIEELIKWRDDNELNTKGGAIYEFVDGDAIRNIPDIVENWWRHPDNPTERNNRLIAIIQWLNGEDVFKIHIAHLL